MKLAFIGGNGHHYLRPALDDKAIDTDRTVPVAGDGVDNEGAKNKWAKLEGAVWYDDAVTMLDKEKPDVVNIGAVYGVNGDLIAECLERDIAVVSDKPIAGSFPQLERLRSLCNRTTRTLLTEFDFRSRPTFRAAQRAIADGLLGEVVLATAQKSYRFGKRPAWYKQRELYTGTILWIASHGIDAIRFATGQKFTAAYGRHGNVAHREYDTMEEFTASVFELANGGTGIVHADYLRPVKAATHGDDRLRVAGGKGVVEVIGDQCLLCTNDEPVRDIAPDMKPKPMHVELLDAIGGDKTLYSTEWSLELAGILLAAREAADGHHVVTIRV